MLSGKLRDETGDILTPTHTQRHGRRFAYYVSHRLIAGGIDPTGWGLPAATIEATLHRIVAAHLRALAERHALLAAPDGTNASNIARRAQALATKVETDPMRVGTLIEVVCLEHDHARLRLATRPISAALDVTTEALDASLLTFVSPLALRRRGVETRIIAGVVQPAPDPMLLRTLAEAHTWARSLKAGRSLTEIATTTGHSEPYIRARIPLAFLAPSVQAAILDGCQPPEMSVASVLRAGIPMAWDVQERLFRLA